VCLFDCENFSTVYNSVNKYRRFSDVRAYDLFDQVDGIVNNEIRGDINGGESSKS